MAKCYDKAMVDELVKIQTQLKEKLETFPKTRVKCAKLQLDFAKLHTTDCLEILNELREISTSIEEKEII